MNILVTGASGYIGSIITEELIRRGNSVVALDSLRQGHREAVAPEATFIQLDLGDVEGVEHLLEHHKIEAVMHLAAESSVEYSMIDPKRYFQNNVIYSMNLLDIMLEHGVNKFVFSSTAAVYGEPQKDAPIEEDAPLKPVNAYGESKLMFEGILHWYGLSYGLKFVSLRYFNAAGASARFGEDHRPETHLIPNVLKVALGQAEAVPIFGTDYPTSDGTCIRDYIHVLDIAKAHILALERLERSECNEVYNLGSGAGYSVIQVIETARKVTGAPIPTTIHPKRMGDPARLVASSRLAKSELGWQPDYPDLERIVESAWHWKIKYPYGYKE